MSETMEPPSGALFEHFSTITDPRVNRTRRHHLDDILLITVCAVICGAEDWVSIERFGRSKEDWFSTFLRLPGGIPSHDTFGRVFAAIDIDEFSRCFTSWVSSIARLTEGEVIAIDGKTVRRSLDRASATSAIHMVSAWATQNRVVLGQVKTEEKSNEIEAIPRLLKMLDLRGCIVTIDAMGCQKDIAKRIVEGGADYILALKGNQGRLCDEVTAHFDSEFNENEHSYDEDDDVGHGRTELRRAWSTGDLDFLSVRDDWEGLSSVIMIESTRTVGDAEPSVERRLYISSLDGTDAEKSSEAIREHWGVENCLHWVLDVGFREDESRARKGNSAANLSVVRRIALNLLKNDTTEKLGVKNKRLAAGWDNRYLLRLLGI